MSFRVNVKANFEDVLFTCQRCGSCCHHRRPEEFDDIVPQERVKEFWEKSNLIYLTEKDINRICRRTKLDPEDFVDTLYEDKKGSVRVEDSGRKVVLDMPVMKTKEDGTCVFYDGEKGCTIHPLRPIACRLFPFLVVEDSTPKGDILLNISYNPSCPGIGKGRPVNKKGLEKMVVDQFKLRTEFVLPQVQKLRAEGTIRPNAVVCRTMPGKKKDNK